MKSDIYQVIEMKPYVIGIAGESGVGKSTISEIISIYYGHNNIIVLSTDDLHKWERTSKAWSSITHLNPEANNLELGDIHLTDLLQGKIIYRSVYNHNTGTFNPPYRIEPKSIIVIEGLHAFYTNIGQQLINLKIFVDTDEELRAHWKIIRDTEERGYKYNDVLEAINKRKADSIAIRVKQLPLADVIIGISTKSKIKVLGDKHELVPLQVDIHSKNVAVDGLLTFIVNYITDFNDFIKATEIVGHNIEMCQNKGGNISVKTGNLMIIKASGYNMKDIHRLGGYSVLGYSNIYNIYNIYDDNELDNILVNMRINNNYKRPSMETGMHISINKKYVLHLHPIYITLLLSLNLSQQIINELFINLDYEYIPYVNPGYELFNMFNNIRSTAQVFFLENHGITIADDNIDNAIATLSIINDTAKRYIRSKCCDFEEFSILFAAHPTEPKHSFPDSVMFWNDKTQKETIAAHNYINIIGSKIGTIRYLTEHQIDTIRNLDSEKYRKTI